MARIEGGEGTAAAEDEAFRQEGTAQGGGVAPRAERTASSGSRRTVRARTRLATLELAMTKSRPEAAKSIQRMVLARELIWSCMRVTPIW